MPFLVRVAIKKDRLQFDPRAASVTPRNVIMMNARHLRVETALDQIMATARLSCLLYVGVKTADGFLGN